MPILSRKPNVFTIPELVEMVLSYILPSQPSELYQLALINITWFYMVIPHLWKSVTLRQALSPLGEIRMVDNEYRFVEPPNPFKWNRFLIYSQHVRALVGHETDSGLLTAIAHSLWRPWILQHLFPNNRSLTWRTWSIDGITSDLPILLSPSTQNLTLLLHDIHPPSFIPLCQAVREKLRVLKSLRLELSHTRPASIDCVTAFQTLLECFASTLRLVQIPGTFQTVETLTALWNIPNLNELAILGPSRLAFRTLSLRSQIPSPINGENIGSLRRLMYTGPQQLLWHVYLHSFPLSNLIQFNWSGGLDPDDPEVLFATLAAACPQLTMLTIGNSYVYKGDRQSRPEPILAWQTIQLLLDCEKLVALSLHFCRVSMTPYNLFELFMSRDVSRPWKVLELFSVIPFSLCFIYHFAQYCPALEYLGLHVLDGCTHNPTDPYHPALSCPFFELPPSQPSSSPFNHLSTIDLAFSQIRSPERIAAVLTELCETVPSVAAWDMSLRREIPTLISQLRSKRAG